MQYESTLAKLIARENLIVTYDPAAKTASFNLKTRTITFPLFKPGTSASIKDTFTIHEVGHALYTFPEDWDKSMEEFSHTLANICEDARIEALIRRDFPGGDRILTQGYMKLWDDGFFSPTGDVKDINLDKMHPLDKINVACKVGAAYAGIRLTDEESALVKELTADLSFEGLVRTMRKVKALDQKHESKRLQQIAEEQIEELMEEFERALQEGQVGSMEGGEGGDSDMEGEEAARASSNAVEFTTPDYIDLTEPEPEAKPAETKLEKAQESNEVQHSTTETQTQTTESQEVRPSDPQPSDGWTKRGMAARVTESGNDTKEEAQDNSAAPSAGKVKIDIGGLPNSVVEKMKEQIEKPITQTAFDGNLSSSLMASENARPSIYDAEMFYDVWKDRNLITIDMVWDALFRRGWNHADYHERLTDYCAKGWTYQTFSNKVNEAAQAMSNQFAQQLSGMNMAMSTERETGYLDMNRLCDVYTSENVFMSETIMGNCKNHGVIILVDFSGSMSGTNVKDVTRRAIIMSKFCRNMEIPYRVIGFGIGVPVYSLSDDLSREYNRRRSDLRHVQNPMNAYKLVPQFDMTQAVILSDEMEQTREEDIIKALWASFITSGSAPGDFAMSGTPMASALLSMPGYINEFKQITGVAKVCLMNLTDGADSGSVSFVAYNSYDGHYAEHDCHYNSFYSNGTIQPWSHAINMEGGNIFTMTTNDIIGAIKAHHPDLYVVSYFLGDASYAFSKLNGRDVHDTGIKTGEFTLDSHYDDLREHGFISVTDRTGMNADVVVIVSPESKGDQRYLMPSRRDANGYVLSPARQSEYARSLEEALNDDGDWSDNYDDEDEEFDDEEESDEVKAARAGKAYAEFMSSMETGKADQMFVDAFTAIFA